MEIDSDFPGGNIMVVSVSEEGAALRPELRDTPVPWFYWYFRVRGGAGRVTTFRFDTPDCVVGALGPAWSLDGGRRWQWLGAKAVVGNGFRCALPEGSEEVRFAVAFPYLQANLEAFLARGLPSPYLSQETLCATSAGRKAELLRAGCLDGEPRARVLVTARHHACESMASFVLEGLLQAVLEKDEAGRVLRECVELLAVPFVDKDGVENGDQGKSRTPHDHNRDYAQDPPRYPTVAAIKALIPTWAAGKLRVHLDLHCPLLRGAEHQEIILVGAPDPAGWLAAQDFARTLRRVQQGPLVYTGAGDLSFGQGWNVGVEEHTSTAWTAKTITNGFAVTIEIPYALAHGAPVTPESARAFGRDLGAALAKYLTS